jgi:hypothetical protein
VTFVNSLFTRSVQIYEVHITAAGTTSVSCWD